MNVAQKGEAGGAPLLREVDPRQASGFTSQLILAYVEREGGRAGVKALLREAGLEGAEEQLRDASQWFGWDTKIHLFEAAAAVLHDPGVARHIGAAAVKLPVAPSLKMGLRAFGSPRLVYQNVVRASGRFTRTHRMESVGSRPYGARLRYRDVTGVGYHCLDCDYNLGLLSAVPRLFGDPPAVIEHTECAVHGAAACIYDVNWQATRPRRDRLAPLLSMGAAAVSAAAARRPGPLSGTTSGPLAALARAARRGLGREADRARSLEAQLDDERAAFAEAAESLHELAMELHLPDVAEKVLTHAQTTVGGAEFAMIVNGVTGRRWRATAGISAPAVEVLERWLDANPLPREHPTVVRQADVPELAGLTSAYGRPLASLCAWPMTVEGQELGVLIALAEGAEAFLPREIELFEVYANQAAIAVQNARLFERSEMLATRDPLTELLNHREFHETLGRELERCRRYGGEFSVLMIDIDGFKAVNDAWGHAEGDRILRAAAQRLQAVCRDADRAFRVGGDEFGVVMAGTVGTDVVPVAERAQQAVESLGVGISISWGIGSWPQDGETKDALLGHADAALYRAKRSVDAPITRTAADASCEVSPRFTDPRADGQRRRLALASRLATALSLKRVPDEIAATAVEALHHSFHYYLAVVHRIDHERGELRPVAAAGAYAERMMDTPGGWRQSLDEGINGRVARRGEAALVADVRAEADFLADQDPDYRTLAELSVPIRVGGEVWGILNLEETSVGAFDEDDLALVTTIADQIGAALHSGSLYAELEHAYQSTLAALSDALEAKDPSTAAHARAIADLAERVAERLDMPANEIRALRYGALMHDIGKISVPADVLAKAAPLSSSEMEEIKRHTVIGERMLGHVPYLAAVRPLVRSCHEHWNGGGYPDGLSGEDIPLGARVIAACDAFHAMTTDRPYRRALSTAGAIAELREGAGTQFDPAVVKALIEEASAQPPAAPARNLHRPVFQ